MTLEKFTKEEVYKFLNKLVSEEVVLFASADYENKFKEIVEENFKPQKGGGATANPPKEIDGVTYHYCRMFQDYLPEDEMVFSQSKCRGISKIGQKYSYELSKQVTAKNMEAIKHFTKGELDAGNALITEAKEIEKSIQTPATYIAERERQIADGTLDKNAPVKNDSTETVDEDDLV